MDKHIYIVVSLDRSLRSFQYNYLMLLTPTNTYLFKRNMIHVDLCDFCFQHNEDCEHLFWRCCHVQHIGNNLIKYLNSKGLLLELTFEIISFGILEKRGLKNFLIFLMKYFIFQYKVQNGIPLFELFINVLNNRIEIKLQIALTHDEFQKFQTKHELMI